MERSVDDIQYILTAALQAPSGDNNQPWQWVVRDLATLELYYEPGPQTTDSVFTSASDYVSLGAACESACIAARARGYETRLEPFPREKGERCVAVLRLTKHSQESIDPLLRCLLTRATNRNPFKRTSLTTAQRAALRSSLDQTPTVTLRLCDDRALMRKIAKAVSVYDELIFGNYAVHQGFFSTINWTKQQDRLRRKGFYYPTLAAPPHVELAFRLLRYWSLQRLLNVFGMQKGIAARNRRVYMSSGAFGALLMLGSTPHDYFEAGRAVERFWLTAQLNGLNLQPMTGILYLGASLQAPDKARLFTPAERARILEANRSLADAFATDSATLPFVFRIGTGPGPRFRTSRRPPDEVVIWAQGMLDVR